MNKIDVKIVGEKSLNPSCIIDGNHIDLKKNNYGVLEGSYQTEKDEIQLTVCRYLELNDKWWLLMSIIFFVISIFGIFNPPYDKKCIQIEYMASVKLKDNSEIKLKINNYKLTDKAIECESNCEISENINKLAVDKKAKKRLSILKLTQIVAWIGIIVIAILLISKANA